MSKQESRLSIAIESQEAVRNAKAVNKELKSIQETGDFAAKSVEGTSKSLTTFSQEGAKGASSAKVLAGQIGSVGTQSKTASDGLGKVTQSTNASATSMNAASTAAQALASRIAAIVTVGAAVSKMDAFAGFENRLKLVTTSQMELNQAMNDTFRIAQNSRQEWDSVVQVYQRFSDNAKTLGIDMKKTAQLTETVSKAVAISGASAASAEAALTQFGQALASGVLRGEELNSVMEQTPGLSKAIAQGMGITVGQLRAVAAEGKITTDVLVEALTKSKDNVDELFNRTDMTIGQSMTYLNNEVTKFTGEAGKSSGAATALAESIKLLGDNLGLITNIAMIGGAYWLGTYIPAIYKSVTAGYAKVQSTVAEMRAEQLANEITVQRSARIAHLTAIELANAQAQAARMSGIAKVAFVEKTLIPLEQANTAAIAANTVVQDANNKSKLLGVGIGSRLIGVLGGPVGLGLTVAGVAASMLLMSGNTKTANEDLKDQSKYAEMANEELAKLEGNKKKYATEILTAELELQNNQLKAAQKEFEALTETIANSNKGNIEAERIWAQVKAGVMTAEQAVAEYNKLSFITSPQMTQLENGQVKIKGLEDKVENANIRLHQVKPASDVAASGIDKVGNAAANTELKVASMSAAYQQFLDKAKSNATKELWIEAYADRTGMTTDQARFFWDAKQANQGKVITQEQANQLDLLYKQGQASKDLDERRQKELQTQQKQTREAEQLAKKQEKLLANGARLVGISGNSGTSTNPHLHVQYGGKKLGDKPTAEHLNRLKAGGKGLASYGVSSGMGYRKPPTQGASSDHKGLDIGMPVGTPITTNVAVKSVTTHTQKKDGKVTGAGHYTRVVFEDGLIMELFHQVPDIHSKIKGGASAGSSNSRSYAQQESYEKKTVEQKDVLQSKFRTAEKDDEVEHLKILKDLREHNLTDLIAKENERYEKTKQLRKLEYTLEVDGWRFVGEERIKNQYAVEKLSAEANAKYGDKERAERIRNIEELRELELSAYRRLQQEKMKEFRSTLEQQTAEYQRMYYDALARASLIQPAYTRWDAQNSYSDQIGAAWDNKQNAINKADEKDSKTDQYLNDANTRYQMYLEAERNYQEQLLAIKRKGVLDERDVMMQSQTDYFGMYNQLLTQASTVWGGMTQMVRDSAGESSAAYKAMFLAQQAIAIGQAIINTEVGATAALKTDPTGFMSMMTRGMGYASVGLIAAQTIQGMAHNGINNIPREGTWLLDGGERVLNPKQNQDLTSYLEKRNSPQDQSPMIERQRLAAIGESKASRAEVLNAPVTVYVTVQSDGSSEVKSEGASKELGLFLGNGVRKMLLDECKQGGIIDNELRRRGR